jgi:hypothetical protein
MISMSNSESTVVATSLCRVTLASLFLGGCISANASASRSRSSSQAESGKTQSSFANRLDASWELDLFGAKRRSVEAAEASWQASQEAIHDVMVSLTAKSRAGGYLQPSMSDQERPYASLAKPYEPNCSVHVTRSEAVSD